MSKAALETMPYVRHLSSSKADVKELQNLMAFRARMAYTESGESMDESAKIAAVVEFIALDVTRILDKDASVTQTKNRFWGKVDYTPHDLSKDKLMARTHGTQTKPLEETFNERAKKIMTAMRKYVVHWKEPMAKSGSQLKVALFDTREGIWLDLQGKKRSPSAEKVFGAATGFEEEEALEPPEVGEEGGDGEGDEGAGEEEGEGGGEEEAAEDDTTPARVGGKRTTVSEYGMPDDFYPNFWPVFVYCGPPACYLPDPLPVCAMFADIGASSDRPKRGRKDCRESGTAREDVRRASQPDRGVTSAVQLELNAIEKDTREKTRANDLRERENNRLDTLRSKCACAVV